jgi:hypothetical protein
VAEAQLEIALKAWSTYQDLSKGMGENCWKIRSVFYTAALGLVAAGFSSSQPVLYVFVTPAALSFFLLEAGYRRLQQQYFEKLREIELTLNDFLANEPMPRFPSQGISTGLDTPTLGAFVGLLVAKRYLFWGPYVLLSTISCALFIWRIQPV